MTERHAILMIEDTPALARTYQGFLRDESYDLQHVESGEEGLEVIARNAPNALLLDLRLPGMDGMEVLRKLRSKGAEFPIIVITAHGSLTTAVEAMRDGASDFLVKPFTAERLKVTLRNLLEKQDLKQTVKSYEAALNRGSFQDFIGSSIVMQGVYRLIEGAAGSRATVFITGESGTGKEVAARAIHSLSPRCDRPFVALNCAAIPRDLMESEIFGHVKGAFTGASAQRDGAADRADGGTLFLDELCEMAPDLQTKLLRFVQTGTFRKVGGDEERQVDVRFVCATNRDPLIEVQEGRFREDLYYRLHVVPIHLPPLRERGEDILEIAEGLLTRFAEEEGKRFSGFQEDARQVLLSYLWPGNVRELENVIRNAVVLNDADCMKTKKKFYSGLISGENQYLQLC